MSLSVIIPSRNVDNLVQCIGAVQACEPGMNIIAVWDASDGYAPATIHSIPLVLVCAPFVFAANVNLGIHYAGWDDVILLNDDALLKTPGGFSTMHAACEANKDFGVISATTNNAGNPNQIRPSRYRMGDLREERRTVNFICVLIPRRTINTVGLLDERFTGYGGDDDDYCLRVRNAGLKLGIYDGCFVDHLSLQSSYRGAPASAGDYSAMHEVFKAKWGQDIWGHKLSK